MWKCNFLVLNCKFFFSFICISIISEALIWTSSLMLRMPMATCIAQGVTLLGICAGLSGMAVGLGAMYPNFKDDNPSKIVSGFGGTLNLVLNIAFVFLCVAVQAAPLVLRYTKLPVYLSGFNNIPVAILLVMSISIIACVIPLRMGMNAFRKLEI